MRGGERRMEPIVYAHWIEACENCGTLLVLVGFGVGGGVFVAFVLVLRKVVGRHSRKCWLWMWRWDVVGAEEYSEDFWV